MKMGLDLHTFVCIETDFSEQFSSVTFSTCPERTAVSEYAIFSYGTEVEGRRWCPEALHCLVCCPRTPEKRPFAVSFARWRLLWPVGQWTSFRRLARSAEPTSAHDLTSTSSSSSSISHSLDRQTECVAFRDAYEFSTAVFMFSVVNAFFFFLHASE